MKIRSLSVVGCLLLTGCGMQLNAEAAGFGEEKKYCSRGESGEKVCFATEEERVADYQRRQEKAAAADRAERADYEAASQAARDKAQAELLARRQQEEADEIAREERRATAERDRKQRQEVAIQEAETKRARIKAMAADKTYAVPVLSAMICRMEAENRAYAEDMQREKRLTAASGVMNLKDRRDIAESMDSNRSEATRLTALLKSRHGAGRMPCKDVWPIVACNQDEDDCTPEVRDYAELWRYGQAELDPEG